MQKKSRTGQNKTKETRKKWEIMKELLRNYWKHRKPNKWEQMLVPWRSMDQPNNQLLKPYRKERTNKQFFKYQGGSNILNKWNLKQNRATTNINKWYFKYIYVKETVCTNLFKRIWKPRWERFLGKHNLAEQS